MPIRYLFLPAGGAVTHATTGALIGQGSSVAGSAAHIAKHATSGALVGTGSTVVGSAARTRVHATDGALVGAGAVVVGSAARAGAVTHATSGALTGPGSAVSGAATYNALHGVTGALSGQGAQIVGLATYNAKHATSGALQGQGSVVAGQSNLQSLGSDASGGFEPRGYEYLKLFASPRKEVAKKVASVAPKAKRKEIERNIVKVAEKAAATNVPGHQAALEAMQDLQSQMERSGDEFHQAYLEAIEVYIELKRRREDDEMTLLYLMAA